MRARHLNAVAAAWLLWSSVGCTGEPNAPASTAGAGGISGAQAAGASAPIAGAAAGMMASMTAGTAAGAAAGPVAGTGGDGAPQAGASGIAPAVDGGAGAGATDSGSTDAMAPLDIPEPVTEPYAWGFGLGVSDMAAAVDFYTTVMEMSVEKEVVRGDRSETILYATQAERGARLILMKYDDDRPTRKITAKLVWQSSRASAINRAASSYPDYVSRITFPVVQFDGPDTYIQEVAGIFDTEGGAIEVPYLVALGFSVSDLAASRAFYSDGLGMEEASVGTFPVTDATGSGTITEYSERHPAGAGIVLQAWTPARTSMNNPVKVVLFVPDAQATADAVVAAGGAIVEPAERTAVYDNRLLIVAKDPDGYLLELVQ